MWWVAVVLARYEHKDGMAQRQTVVVKLLRDGACRQYGVTCQVMQVQHRESGEIFALKTMRKNHVVQVTAPPLNDTIGDRAQLSTICHPITTSCCAEK